MVDQFVTHEESRERGLSQRVQELDMRAPVPFRSTVESDPKRPTGIYAIVTGKCVHLIKQIKLPHSNPSPDVTFNIHELIRRCPLYKPMGVSVQLKTKRVGSDNILVRWLRLPSDVLEALAVN